ncbi:hypothetical protein GGR55DRAFT_654913 [Xylaria sp. FL0064]|nr:hypothetical protein GGR55DRAFT_654913 [Xylaria sp. FL0064]
MCLPLCLKIPAVFGYLLPQYFLSILFSLPETAGSILDSTCLTLLLRKFLEPDLARRDLGSPHTSVRQEQTLSSFSLDTNT